MPRQHRDVFLSVLHMVSWCDIMLFPKQPFDQPIPGTGQGGRPCFETWFPILQDAKSGATESKCRETNFSLLTSSPYEVRDTPPFGVWSSVSCIWADGPSCQPKPKDVAACSSFASQVTYLSLQEDWQWQWMAAWEGRGLQKPWREAENTQ